MCTTWAAIATCANGCGIAAPSPSWPSWSSPQHHTVASGRSSLSLSNNPLIYIDGIRVNSASGTGPVAVAGGLGGQGSQVGGRLNDINPDDIESIEVISGPAAAPTPPRSARPSRWDYAPR